MKDKFKQVYIKVAEQFAELSTAKRAQVGAIIVKDNRIISTGYNGMPSGWTNDCETAETWNDVHHMRDKFIEDGAVMHSSPHGNTWSKLKTKPEVLHAESNAICKLARSSESGEDASAFVTHQPCLDCAKLLYQSGITHVYYVHPYRLDHGLKFLKECGIHVEQMVV